MDRRERMLIGANGFDLDWWILQISFSALALRDIKRPHWLAWLLCKMGKHGWWLHSEFLANPAIYKCDKCGLLTQRARDAAPQSSQSDSGAGLRP